MASDHYSLGHFKCENDHVLLSAAKTATSTCPLLFFFIGLINMLLMHVNLAFHTAFLINCQYFFFLERLQPNLLQSSIF